MTLHAIYKVTSGDGNCACLTPIGYCADHEQAVQIAKTRLLAELETLPAECNFYEGLVWQMQHKTNQDDDDYDSGILPEGPYDLIAATGTGEYGSKFAKGIFENAREMIKIRKLTKHPVGIIFENPDEEDGRNRQAMWFDHIAFAAGLVDNKGDFNGGWRGKTNHHVTAEVFEQIKAKYLQGDDSGAAPVAIPSLETLEGRTQLYNELVGARNETYDTKMYILHLEKAVVTEESA